MVNGFVQGSSTFVCIECGKTTRYTGVQSVGSELCPYCYELAGYENALNDGQISDFNNCIENLNVRYSRKETVN